MSRFLINFLGIVFLYDSQLLCAQEVIISSPQKITPGMSKVEILGKNSQGLLIRHTMKEDEEILAYYDNMQLRWKKPTPHRDKNAKTEKILVYPDSVLFFYSETSRGVTVLKSFKTNSRIESSTIHRICDTLSRNLLNPIPRTHFVTSPDKQFILGWFEDVNFENNELVHLFCINDKLKILWKSYIRIAGFENPAVITATLDSSGNVAVISGDYKARNFNNDFPYSGFLISTVKEKGKQVRHSLIQERDVLFSDCAAALDLQMGNVLLAGLYSHNVGNESNGIFLFTYDTVADSLITKSYETHSDDFISQLTGSNPPRKNEGFYDFHPKQLIVKRDGGAIFVAQSESISSEAYSNPPFGGFGLSTGFTVNYFHYDELAVLSFRKDGTVEWKQILHKKQSSEGDGGFFSSITTMIAPSQLHFIFNDAISGQTIVSGFSVDASGNQKRNEFFSAERKGVNVVPRQAQQISATEIILPSFKKNYLQFVKITF